MGANVTAIASAAPPFKVAPMSMSRAFSSMDLESSVELLASPFAPGDVVESRDDSNLLNDSMEADSVGRIDMS